MLFLVSFSELELQEGRCIVKIQGRLFFILLFTLCEEGGKNCELGSWGQSFSVVTGASMISGTFKI